MTNKIRFAVAIKDMRGQETKYSPPSLLFSSNDSELAHPATVTIKSIFIMRLILHIQN